MDPEEEQRIQRLAREWADGLFAQMDASHPDRITVDWLCSMHLDLSLEDAEVYRQFCASRTITLRGCYGRGEIMWPKWQAFLAELASL